MAILRTFIIIALLLWLSIRGIQKKSLSYSGALAAVVLGGIIFSHPSPVFGSLLLTFYLSSSKLTKFKCEIKKQLEENHLEGGQRNAVQVLSNGLTGMILCCLHWRWISQTVDGTAHSPKTNALIQAALFAYIGHFACCNGDTWASELGVLSRSNPILITTFQTVPKGTNGGVSAFGTAAAIVGGLCVGTAAAVTLYLETTFMSRPSSPIGILVLIGAAAGFGGSMIDSLLGATLQKSIFNKDKKQIVQDHRVLKAGESPESFKHISGLALLDNHQVNFASSLITATATGVFGYWLYTTGVSR
ncbi:hypothetical protein BDV3_000563 [Batrachochytrium dendrobatidis]|uniref:TIGR00297 family protein n=1 Tax=Batrachochytrium dendrobatidis (strain JEL423) TaxID=403673 RepID=A0A177W8E4_BATDL|nr:TIGR00297 family protein [Batrachochytrium dendrobatidis JEL423]